MVESRPLPLMPRATAIWLVENTALSFEQIAQFCGLHILEIRAIADGEGTEGLMGYSPIDAGQLDQEEIDRCVADSTAELRLKDLAPEGLKRGERSRYTPRARRGERPDAIAWLLKHYPNISDGQIIKLIGTTKATIENIRSRGHWNMANIKPRSPVVLGFCTQAELDTVESKIPPSVA